MVLRSSSEDWNLALWWSPLLQPEWGTTTVLVSVDRASRMMVILTASHDDRFHRTPAGRGGRWGVRERQEFPLAEALLGY